MKLQYAFLCELVELTERNSFNVYGGGIAAIRFKKLPDHQPLALVLCVEYNLLQESGNHDIEIRFIDGKGADVMTPEKFDGVFANDCNLYHMKFEFTPTFYQHEEHNVIIMINGVEIASIPVEILPAETSRLEPNLMDARVKREGDATSYNNYGKWRDDSRTILRGLLDTEEMKEFKSRLQHNDVCLVKRCADSLALTLLNFMTNDALELYFNVYKNDNSLCYISKGWSDLGFRVGELIEIDKNIPDFKERFAKIFNICSGNLIAVKVTRAKSGNVELGLEIGLYQDGFNEKVLRKAIDSIQDSLQKIRLLLNR